MNTESETDGSKNRRRNVLSLLITAASFALFALAWAGNSGPTPYPSQEAGWPGQGVTRVYEWMNDNRQHFWSRRNKDKGAIVFAGDSLVAGWSGLESRWHQVKVANRGIGGDVSRGLLFRLQEDVLDLQPHAVVLLVGTNDLSAYQAPKITISNIERMIERIGAVTPHALIYVCTIPPRDNPTAPIKSGALHELNTLIRSLPKSYPTVTVIDIHARLSKADGSFEPKWFARDRLHLSTAGYDLLSEMFAPAMAHH